MLRILVIDESGEDSRHTKAVLEAQGMQVMTVFSAEQGIETARRCIPDIIFTDVVLPGISGFQATRLLKMDSQTKNIPVIIMSNRAQEYNITWGLRQGAQTYLIKPVSADALLKSIYNALPPHHSASPVLAAMEVKSIN